jgi:hypothetical protein
MRHSSECAKTALYLCFQFRAIARIGNDKFLVVKSRIAAEH